MLDKDDVLTVEKINGYSIEICTFICEFDSPLLEMLEDYNFAYANVPQL